MDFDSYIKDNRTEAIKKLFEFAVRNTVEKCRLDFRLAHLYSTPCPCAYDSYEDWRTLNDRMIEAFCEAKIILAFNLAQPIRERLDFYDLICCAMPYSKDDEHNKYIYNEIVRYTKSDKLRDEYVEKLYKLNVRIKALHQPRITEKIRNYVVNFEETKRAFDILLDHCELPYNPYVVSILNDEISNKKRIEISVRGDVLDRVSGHPRLVAHNNYE